MTLKDSLIEQLKRKHADIKVFMSLIDDYCFFDAQLKEMKKDIKKRGRVYLAISSQGKEYEKENPSVANALRYSQQMLKILQQMGLSVDNVEYEVEDAENM